MSKILIEAAKIGDLTTIKKLIIDNPNIDVDCYDDTIVTALHYAAKNGYAEIVDELIKKQAWVDRLNGKSETALHCAVESRHIVIVNKLLDAKANIDALDTYSQTPLFKAIQNSDFTLFEILLARGANVYSQNYNDETLLHYAAQYGCVRIMEQLTQLKNMEFLELQNLEGLTALHFAAIYDHTDMVELLLNAQANIHAVTEKSETPLHCAAQKGNTATALKLIERKINIEAQNVDGETALFCAVRAGCAPIVEMLIHAKANIEAKNLEGKTALQCAVELNQNAIVEILLCHGAIVSADFRWIVSFHSPSSSNSALDMLYHADNLLSLVKRKNRKHDVDLLRKLKTGLNGKEHVGGNTALHLAILSENVKLTALLFEFGAAMDMPNKENKTVVDYVNKSDNPRIKFAYLKRLLKDLQDKRSVSHLSTSIPTLTLSAEKDVKNIKESKDIKSLIERDSTATAASGSAASTSTSSSGSAGAVASMTCYSQRETTQIGKEKVEPEQTLLVLDTLVKNIISYIEKNQNDKQVKALSLDMGNFIVDNINYFPTMVGIAYQLLTSYGHDTLKETNTRLYTLLLFANHGFVMTKENDGKIKLSLADRNVSKEDCQTSLELMNMMQIKHLLASNSDLQEISNKLIADALGLPDSISAGIEGVKDGSPLSMFALLEFLKSGTPFSKLEKELGEKRAELKKLEEDKGLTIKGASDAQINTQNVYKRKQSEPTSSHQTSAAAGGAQPLNGSSDIDEDTGSKKTVTKRLKPS